VRERERERKRERANDIRKMYSRKENKEREYTALKRNTIRDNRS
jgi:hypothetical protein